MLGMERIEKNPVRAAQNRVSGRARLIGSRVVRFKCRDHENISVLSVNCPWATVWTVTS